MPLRAIDTRSTRLLERRHASTRAGRPVVCGPDRPAADEPEIDRPFDDWPYDYDPGDAPADGGGR